MQSNWSQMLFTDESQFNLECNTQRVLVWRESGTRKKPIVILERSYDRRGGLTVWAGISIGERTNLFIPLTIQRLKTRPHAPRLVENFLEAEKIHCMEWPGCSPGFNPIEHVWDTLDDALLQDQFLLLLSNRRNFVAPNRTSSRMEQHSPKTH
ncbi:transposable element Tcb1 transposase [Trichonephila clavipes]|nr:transposable element Tcb1 transposase [Trichonephila clavipes]